jgi:hypothetical protein
MDLIEGGIEHPIKHWYYSHKFWFIKKAFIPRSEKPRKLIDIGAGSALFSSELLRLNLVGSVVAIDTGYEEDYTDSASGMEFRCHSDFQGFTDYLLTDVLEHVENDLAFLKNVVTAASVDSKFVITVPAMTILWSNHDVYLKHFRRYSKNELRKVVLKAGLTIDECRYTYSSVFLVAYLQRRFLNKRIHGSHLRENNKFVVLLLQLSLIPDRWFAKMPFGVSLYLTATKN